ncbi:MAG: hypothetical protein HY075_05055 [Deltaproteobacteria bacterium]|nr:hypothetical protein [Deltaproteobacteria bacterium]
MVRLGWSRLEGLYESYQNGRRACDHELDPRRRKTGARRGSKKRPPKR